MKTWKTNLNQQYSFLITSQDGDIGRFDSYTNNGKEHAKLISLAPEMLEVLELLVGRLELDAFAKPQDLELKEAIAKATTILNKIKGGL